MQLIFWALMSLILYTYVGYPMLLVLLAYFRKKKLKKREIFPYVSMIITAYNEEKYIKDKLKNCLESDYPEDRFEVIVASDASADSTDKIVKQFNNEEIKLIRVEGRVGKTEVQNRAVRQAKGEIIIFSDATTIFEPQTLKRLVANFADSGVGVVGGGLVYLNKAGTAVGEGNSLYWRFEKFLKKKESQVTSLIGVSGCCYAVRKELYEPIRPDLISDFVIAQIVYKKGKRVVYEPEAISYEETNDNAGDEFKMRVRVAVRTLYGLWRMKELLNPVKYGFYSIQLISHKILRYLIPIFIISLFLVNFNLSIENQFVLYKYTFYLQILFYLSAALGLFFKKLKPYLYVPLYFCATNFALLVGLCQFLGGNKKVRWKPSRK